MTHSPTTYAIAQTRRIAGFVALALMLTVATGSSAEQQQGFDDAKLDAFVEAAVKVESIKIAAIAKAQTLSNGQELESLQQETHDALVTAVEATDNMSVDEYNSIVNASRGDEALKQRIATKIERKVAELESEQEAPAPEQSPRQPSAPNAQ